MAQLSRDFWTQRNAVVEITGGDLHFRARDDPDGLLGVEVELATFGIDNVPDHAEP